MKESQIIEAIDDLIRVTLAFRPEFISTADSIRRLHIAGVKQSRIASLLGIDLKRVTSTVTKFRQSNESKVTKDVSNGKK